MQNTLQPEATAALTAPFDLVVVGSGISGLYTALKAADRGCSVLLLTKSKLSENNSRYAQGGIAAVLPENTQDSVELHIQDTLKAGAGLCDTKAVESILGEGYEAVADLLLYGVPFDRDQRNQLALTKEAAHSVQRILHAGGDATGHSVESTLIERVEQHKNIHYLEYVQVQSLDIEDQQLKAIDLFDLKTSQGFRLKAKSVVLATGGVGRLYQQTTNPVIATGDGMALAKRAGIPLKDMEFIQFHPTAFYYEGKVRFLISEALRGEGGYLRNQAGERFAQASHPDGELAPRDVVTRAIFSEMRKDNTPNVWLDMTHLPAELLERRFPTIFKMALGFQVDLRKEPLPVAPAAHYCMGGIACDLNGGTAINGLYVVGEAACTGLHGANRLASNSLLECLVLARRVALQPNPQPNSSLLKTQTERIQLSEMAEPSPHLLSDEQSSADWLASQKALHGLMWNELGIVRIPERMKEAQLQLNHWYEEAKRLDAS